MIKGLILKEWIKTRWVLPTLYLIGIGMMLYDLMALERVITFRGASHLWEILLTKDVLLLGVITYQPLFTGVVMAVAQFVPEMTQKRLKLTLHLPLRESSITATMLGYGVAALFLLFAQELIMLWGYSSMHLAPELVRHLLVSVAPWFLAGLAGYGMASLTILEPTRVRRVLYLAVGFGVVKLFFVTGTPRAYQGSLWWLLPLVLLLCFASLLSVARFKDGIQ